MLLLAVATAQSENEDVIAHCARISSPGDRILCLEDALRGPVPVESAKPQDEVPTDTAQVPQETLPEADATETRQFGLTEAQKNRTRQNQWMLSLLRYRRMPTEN